MHDSPVALLAWQLEKFEAWSDASLRDAYSKDQVLANVALYWFTETANSASRLYCESKRAGNYAADPWEGRVEIPVGYCRYPGEMLQTPRVWAEKRYSKIVHWTEAGRERRSFRRVRESELLRRGSAGVRSGRPRLASGERRTGIRARCAGSETDLREPIVRFWRIGGKALQLAGGVG